MKEEMKGKISVIVPVYNGQDYITSCIESIVTQAVSDMEIIIINDGSVDRTAQICYDLQEKYHNIQIITLEDLGVSAARNAGLSKATGDYITFVDADDRLLPGTLSRLQEIAVRTGSDIVGCGFAVWFGEEDFSRLSSGSGEEPLGSISPRELSYTGLEYIDKGILNGDTRCWSKLYRKESIQNIRFQEGLTIGEDMLFLLEAIIGTKKITITDCKGYGYFQNPKGVMNRIFKDSYMDQITCWQTAAKRIEQLRPDLVYKVMGIVMISVMLTVGKIAELPRNLHKEYKDRMGYCRQQLKEAKRIPGAYAGLDRGYQVKIKIFERFPDFYVKAYHWWKGRSD